VEKILKNRLEGSVFSDPDIFKNMKEAFEREVSSQGEQLISEFSSDHVRQLKPTFDATKDQYTFKFGTNGDNDPDLGIHKGRISLSNKELKPVFDAVINKIITNCSNALVSQRTEVRNRTALLHIF
jgi:hypothetical protein